MTSSKSRRSTSSAGAARRSCRSLASRRLPRARCTRRRRSATPRAGSSTTSTSTTSWPSWPRRTPRRRRRRWKRRTVKVKEKENEGGVRGGGGGKGPKPLLLRRRRRSCLGSSWGLLQHPEIAWKERRRQQRQRQRQRQERKCNNRKKENAKTEKKIRLRFFSFLKNSLLSWCEQSSAGLLFHFVFCFFALVFSSLSLVFFLKRERLRHERDTKTISSRALSHPRNVPSQQVREERATGNALSAKEATTKRCFFSLSQKKKSPLARPARNYASTLSTVDVSSPSLSCSMAISTPPRQRTICRNGCLVDGDALFFAWANRCFPFLFVDNGRFFSSSLVFCFSATNRWLYRFFEIARCSRARVLKPAMVRGIKERAPMKRN